MTSQEKQKKIVELAESKFQEIIIRSEKCLIDKKDHENHPESFYTSQILSKLIEQANSFSHSYYLSASHTQFLDPIWWLISIVIFGFTLRDDDDDVVTTIRKYD